MTPTELRKKAAELRDKLRALLTLAEKEDRELNADELSLEADYKTKAEEYDRRAVKAEEVDALIAAGRESTGRAGEPISGRSPVVEVIANEEDKTRSFGDFLKHIAMASDHVTGRGAHERLTKVYGSTRNDWAGDKRSPEVRALAQSSGITGGYTVPPQFYNSLMEVAAESSIVRPRAMVLPMATDEVDIPILNQTTAPTAGNSAFFGGVAASWTAEAAQIGSTEPNFKQVRLTAHELTGYTAVSRTLIQNSAISVDALLTRLFGAAVGWYEDYAFLRGDGVGKPLGVSNAPALVATAARGSATAISFANARLCWVRVPQASRMKAVWVVSNAAEEKVLDMAGTANSVFVPSGAFITDGNAAAKGVNYTLLGRPVLVSEKMPALNTQGDFGVYDFSQYIVGDRGQMEIATSEHYLFRNNQTAFRFVHRVGGMPWLDSSITLQDTSTTLSPFVQLAIQ